MTRRVYALIAVLTMIVWLTPSLAALEATPISLEQAVREAIERNLALAAERYTIALADARVITARLRPNPVLTLGGIVPDRTIFDTSINPFEEIGRVDFLMERGGKRERRIEVAEEAHAVAELQVLNTMRSVVMEVENSFIEVLLAKAGLQLARDNLRAFDEIVNVNVHRVRTGDLAEVELARSRLAALQFENDVRQRQAKLVVAEERLKMLIGRAGAPGRLEAVGELRHDRMPLGVEELRAQALRLRPDVQALVRDRARSAAEIRSQIAQGKIDYTFSGEYHRQQGAVGGRTIGGNLFAVYFSAPIPLFNRNQGEIVRAQQEQQQVAARLQALEAEVTNEVLTAYEQHVTARDLLERIEQDMLSQARDVRRTMEYSYRRGEASFVELLDAQRAFNDTMQSYNEARAEYARSLYQIEAISGKAATP